MKLQIHGLPSKRKIMIAKRTIKMLFNLKQHKATITYTIILGRQVKKYDYL